MADEVASEGSVIELTDSNFDEELAKHEFLLVEFYSPTCRPCLEMAPEYANAAAELALQNPPRRLAKVNTVENRGLTERFNI